MLATIDENPWLNSLGPTAKQAVLQHIKFKHLPTGGQLHAKGQEAETLHCVISGELRISASARNGDQLVLTRVTPGNWFGEIGLLDGGLRTHDAYAMEDTQLAILHKSDLRLLWQEHFEVYQGLVELLCLHCREAFNTLDDFLLLTPQQRLAKRLLAQVPDKNRLPVTLNINQQELAELAGISRQTINKCLKEWEAKRWLQRYYGGITVLDYVSIETFCAGKETQ